MPGRLGRVFHSPNPRGRLSGALLRESDMDMTVTAQQVKELREMTGVGMMDCKKALAETNGDMEAAIDWLRTRGLAKAAKKAGRVAAEGLVGVAIDGVRG